MISVLKHRSLWWQLVKRAVATRYRGTTLGMAWSLVTPLLMLSIYTFVFSVVFRARWPLPDDQPQGQFALILFTGLMIHMLAAESLTQATKVVTSQVNYVKKVVFPLEILPLVPLGSAVIHYGYSLIVLLGAKLWLTGTLEPNSLWLPVILLPYIIGMMGAVWFLAALGVYMRDIGQIIGLIVMMLLFLSPIFYPPDALPENFQFWLALNPLTVIINEARAVLLWNETPNFLHLGIYSLCSVSAMLLGYGFFHKTRKGFADVL